MTGQRDDLSEHQHWAMISNQLFLILLPRTELTLFVGPRRSEVQYVIIVKTMSVVERGEKKPS